MWFGHKDKYLTLYLLPHAVGPQKIGVQFFILWTCKLWWKSGSHLIFVVTGYTKVKLWCMILWNPKIWNILPCLCRHWLQVHQRLDWTGHPQNVPHCESHPPFKKRWKLVRKVGVMQRLKLRYLSEWIIDRTLTKGSVTTLVLASACSDHIVIGWVKEK